MTVSDLIAEQAVQVEKAKALNEYMHTASFLAKSKHEQNLYFGVWVSMQQTGFALTRLIEAIK